MPHADNDSVAPPPDPKMVTTAMQLRKEFTAIQLQNEFAIDEVLTKVSILRKEFLQLHRYNPIEHVNSRLKSPESTLKKIIRLGVAPTAASIREHVKDIAGVRITCSFIADTYRVLDALTSQDDVSVVRVRDYIKHPKPNGYKSLHALIEIPVFLSTGPVPVTVEVQVRTIAMDFWASLEHKIYYKYEGSVPSHLVENLTAAARVSEELDEKMEKLYSEVRDLQGDDYRTDIDGVAGDLDLERLQDLWRSAASQVTRAE
ncbi:MAG: GTP pyrophosphokinase family protein [Arachnia sp.]